MPHDCRTTIIRRSRGSRGCGTLVLLACVYLASDTAAQVRVVPAPPNASRSAESQDGVFLPYDRTLSRGVKQALERIEAGEFTQAIRFLDEVLQSDKEDSFVMAGEEGAYTGLKEMARRILSQLPEEGRQLYESTYGPVARRALKQAVSEGDFEVIRQVAYRYFQTAAGQEAALVLAQHEADLGRYLSAALAYDELLRSPHAVERFEPQLSLLAAEAWVAADNQAHAESLLRHLGSTGHREVSIAGERVQLDALADRPLEWLIKAVGVPVSDQLETENEWLTMRGNASRNGQAAGGLPHMRVRWAVRLLSHPDLEEVCDNLAGEIIRQEQALPVAAAPLAVGDYVITCSPHSLIAVDYRTGKRVWQAQPQRVPQFEQLISASANSAEDQSNVEATRVFRERVWRDYLYSSIGSDGERVYVIRDLTLPSNMQVDPFGMPGVWGDEARGDPTRSNRLCAYELSTQGKLVWEVDGATNRDELAGAFFLGAPLAIGQSLYVIAEVKSAIYLVALDRQTGAFQWQQQLVSLEADIVLDTFRRLQGATPSYDGGILVCPTGAGVVVGVDLAKHALSWAYRYDTDRAAMNVLRMRQEIDFTGGGRWLDSALIIDDGKVLVSPPESGALHCLDLVTGKLRWKTERGDNQFVAGVEGRRVLVVGNKHLTALDLDTGKPVWPREKWDLPQGAQPSGRGFFSDGRYYLPLSSAVVLAIDMQTGVEIDRAVARDGEVLGNLICHRGAVLSQSGRFLDCFDQIDVLRAESERSLAENPEDYEALRTLGEIAYNEGRLAEAIDYLEKALDGAADSLRTKEVLAECLEVALDEDFATYRHKLPLLEELAQSSGQGRLTLLRLQSQGLLESGAVVEAFQACLALDQSTQNSSEMLAIGRDHEVQLARWIRAQADSIWTRADRQERDQIARLLAPVIEQIEISQDDAALRRLVASFTSLAPVEPLQLKLAAGLETTNPLAAQQQLMRLAESASEQVRAEAVARCSRILHHRQQPRQAQMFDERLRGEFAEVVCLDGMTGKECLALWATVDLLGGLDWPYGQVEVASAPTSGRSAVRQGRSPLSRIRLERTDGVLGRGAVFMSIRRAEVIARDSTGVDFFTAPLDEADRLQIHDPSNYYGVSRGSLLVVSQGGQFVAFNTLASGENGEIQTLWRSRIAGSIEDRYRSYVALNARDARRPGPSQAPRPQQNDQWTGVIGPLTHDSCIFQDQRKLVCVDSLTGEVRWWRTDVPQGCDLFGDEEFVFAVPRESKQALIFSAVDGRPVGESAVPRWTEQLATHGRQVIRWHKRVSGSYELSAVDAHSGQVIWQHDFENRSRIDIAESRYAAIVEPSGRCVIVDIADGTLLVDHHSHETLPVHQTYLLVGSDNFVLVAQTPLRTLPERRISKLNQFDYEVIDGHVFVFDRRTGQSAWSRSAEVRQESFVLSQPVDLPIVAFAGAVNRRNAGGGRQAISLVLLEKASGRLLFQDDTLPQSSANHCEIKVVDPLTHDLAVEMTTQTVRLKFTDHPRPPEPPAKVGGESNVNSGPGGLYGIGKKLFGGD